MTLIEKMKSELASTEEAIYYMEENDTAWYPEYARLCKKRRTLKRTIRRLERLEARDK